MSGPGYFVILGSMRTGSNLLESLLADVPGLACFGEVFNPAFLGRPKTSTVAGWDRARRNADPVGCLAALRVQAGAAMPGFRLFDGHDAAVIAHVLADPACARIILTRHPAESYVSLLIARATDQWLLKRPKRRRQARVRFDAAEFTAYHARLAAHHAALEAGLARAGQSALRVDYADLLQPGTIPSLARALGHPVAAAPAPTILRQNPEPLAEKVENPADLIATLAALGLPPPEGQILPPLPPG